MKHLVLTTVRTAICAVRDIFLTRFSDRHPSCASFSCLITLPSSLFSHVVVLAQNFRSPSIHTRRCLIFSRLSVSFLTPFAFTHAAVLANDRIFAQPPHSCMPVKNDRLFAAFIHSAHSHLPLLSHPIAFSQLLHPP